MNNRLTVTFPTIKKRGLVAIFLAPWDGPALLFVMAGTMALGAIVGAIAQKSFSPLGGLLAAAMMGGIGYLMYRKAHQGTSYIKGFFKMRVLRKDKVTGGYRYLTANEYTIRQALAVAYLPVAYAIGIFPTLLGAAIGGGVAAATNSNRYQGSDYNGTLVQKYEDDQNNQRAAIAATAGAAIGAALTDKLIAKFPWLFTLHDTIMNTIVIDETEETKKWFEVNKEIHFDAPASAKAA